MVKTYQSLCLEVRRALLKAEPDTAAVTARELVAFSAGKTVAQLLRDGQLAVPRDVQRKLDRVLLDYQCGKPLAYILGQWSFCGLTFKVTEQVLIPRDDTMVVTGLALEVLRDMEKPRVLDLCTGSGCIGITIAVNAPHARVTLADISDEALAVAKENVAAHNLTKQVSLIRADALQPAPGFLGHYDVIVSNPPYITGREMKQLPVSVGEYEPHLALYGGEDGLDFYRSICKNFAPALRDGGWLCLEFGLGQERDIEAILKENQFGELLFCRDTSDIIRAVLARKMERNTEYGEEEKHGS